MNLGTAVEPDLPRRPGRRGSGRGALRPLLLAFVGVLAVVSVVLGIRWLSRPPKSDVILIIIDTLRLDALGTYGNARNVSPHMDALAGEGVRFTQAIATSGWTLPSIASVFTGAWPTIHGAMGKDMYFTPIREEIPTVAGVLREHGYRTLGLGNAAFASPMLGLDRGFDVFDHRYAYNFRLRRADETLDDALELIRQHRDEPKFLFIHIFDPHLNYDPPEEYRHRFTDGRSEPARITLPLIEDMMMKGPLAQEDIDHITALYLGEVRFVDDQLGRFLDELKEMGLYDEALLVVTSDHGEEFWDHGKFEHGHALYDELVRVPLILKLPEGLEVSSAVVDTQVRLLDIMPTVFDLIGVNQPDSFVGQSLLPLLAGEASESPIAFSESTLYGTDKTSWRTGRYKLISGTDPSGEVKTELYDWREDPGETRDLSTLQPAVTEELLAKMNAFHADLQHRALTMSVPEVKNMHPEAIQRLKSLGYLR